MYVSTVPLTLNKTYAVHVNDEGDLNGTLWNGTAWENQETVCSDVNRHSVVAYGDNVHLVYRNASTYYIYHMERVYGSGWGSQKSVGSGVSNSNPSLSIDASNGILYCFYVKNDNIYYNGYIGNDWGNALLWTSDTDIQVNSITSFYQIWNVQLGFLYTQGSGSPYNVKFAFNVNNYVFHGPYSEATGQRDYTGINVTAHFTQLYQDSFLLNGTTQIQYPYKPVCFFFDLGYNQSRVYYVNQDTETIYVMKPSEPYYTYSFTVVDYVGISNGYLESLFTIQGASRVVERWSLELLSQIPLTLSWGRIYSIRLICDEGTHTWGDFAAKADQTQELLIMPGIFPIPYPGLNVTVNAARMNETWIQANYTDTQNLTSWVKIDIQHREGFTWTTDYTQNNTGNSQQQRHAMENRRLGVFLARNLQE